MSDEEVIERLRELGGAHPGPDGLVTRMQVFFVYKEEQARAAAGLGSAGSG